MNELVEINDRVIRILEDSGWGCGLPEHRSDPESKCLQEAIAIALGWKASDWKSIKMDPTGYSSELMKFVGCCFLWMWNDSVSENDWTATFNIDPPICLEEVVDMLNKFKDHLQENLSNP